MDYIYTSLDIVNQNAGKARQIGTSCIRNFEDARQVLEGIIPQSVAVYCHRVVFHVPDHAVDNLADKRKFEKAGFVIRDRDLLYNSTRLPGKKLTIIGPSKAAIELVLEIDHQLFAAELALDAIFKSIRQTQAVHSAMERLMAQPWARTRDFRIVHDTLYTGQRRIGPHSHLAVYVKDRCRLHIERRYVGLPMLRRIDIKNASDLLQFIDSDFWQNEFWSKQLRGLFVSVDLQHYGRSIANRASNSRRQKPRITETSLKSGRVFRYDCDRAIGGAGFKIESLHPDRNSRSMQQFIKRVGRKSFIHSIPMDHYQPHHL
jgi:hypothetical protein